MFPKTVSMPGADLDREVSIDTLAGYIVVAEIGFPAMSVPETDTVPAFGSSLRKLYDPSEAVMKVPELPPLEVQVNVKPALAGEICPDCLTERAAGGSRCERTVIVYVPAGT